MTTIALPDLSGIIIGVSVLLRKNSFNALFDPVNQYALVHLDADLYSPQFSGLQYFYPRMTPGGVIIIHDCNNEFSGSIPLVVSGKYPGINLTDADLPTNACTDSKDELNTVLDARFSLLLSFL